MHHNITSNTTLPHLDNQSSWVKVICCHRLFGRGNVFTERERNFSRKTKTELWKTWPTSLWCLKGSQMCTYIYILYIFIYIYIKYCKLESVVFQILQEANFTPSPQSWSLQWWDVSKGSCFFSYIPHRILIKATQQLAGQLFENSVVFALGL